MSRGGQREREIQNPKQALGSEPSAQSRTLGSNREIMTRAEVGRLTDRATKVPLPCMVYYNNFTDE